MEAPIAKAEPLCEHNEICFDTKTPGKSAAHNGPEV